MESLDSFSLSVTSPTSQLILQPLRFFTYVTAHSPTLLSLLLRHKFCSFSNLSVTSLTSLLILQSFRRFTYVTAHSPTLLSLLLRHKLLILQPFRHFTYVTTHSPTLTLLHLRHSSSPTLLSFLLRQKLCSFSKLSVSSPTSLLILQSFRRFTYVIAHSPTLPLLHVTSSAHSPTFLSLHLRHYSLSNPSVAPPISKFILQPFFSLLHRHKLCLFSNLSVTSPTSLLILQSFRRFTYVTAHSPTFLSLLVRHKLFT